MGPAIIPCNVPSYSWIILALLESIKASGIERWPGGLLKLPVTSKPAVFWSEEERPLSLMAQHAQPPLWLSSRDRCHPQSSQYERHRRAGVPVPQPLLQFISLHPQQSAFTPNWRAQVVSKMDQNGSNCVWKHISNRMLLELTVQCWHCCPSHFISPPALLRLLSTTVANCWHFSQIA